MRGLVSKDNAVEREKGTRWTWDQLTASHLSIWISVHAE